ncbi:MAG: hypothetical protein AB4063_19740 [Crocosphaera sp.]
MANKNPVMGKEFEEQKLKPIGEIPGNIPLGGKTWGVRLPKDVEAFLNNWDKTDRTARIETFRRILVENIRNLPEFNEWENEQQ